MAKKANRANREDWRIKGDRFQLKKYNLHPHLVNRFGEAEKGSAEELYWKRKILEELDRQERAAFCRVFGRQQVGRRSKPCPQTLRFRVDPSGFFSLSLVPKSGKRTRAIPPTSCLSPEPNSVRLLAEASSSAIAPEPFSPPSAYMGLSVSVTDETPDRSRSQASDRHSRPRLRGQKGLTSLAKRYLVGSCKRLQSLYGKHALAFHTATLPTDDPQIKRRALERSRSLLKTFRDRLSRLLASRGLDKDRIVIVLELQKRGAIHLHSVFQFGQHEWDSTLRYSDLDKVWRQACCAILPELRSANFSSSCRTERIRKCVGRYLAKYLSKAEKVPEAWKLSTSITWYSVGNLLKREFDEGCWSQNLELDDSPDFEALASALVSSGLAFSLTIFSLPGFGARCLYGYLPDRLTSSPPSLYYWLSDYLVASPSLTACGKPPKIAS